jgi:hypothetical protein
VNNTFYDDLNDHIIYSPAPNWQPGSLYPGTVLPPGIVNTTFHGCTNKGATAYMRFTGKWTPDCSYPKLIFGVGSAIFVYSPCFRFGGNFSATIDANANTQPQIYNAYIPGDAVVENCLLYYAAGLDRSATHEFVATALDQGPTIAIDYIEIWTNGFLTKYGKPLSLALLH